MAIMEIMLDILIMEIKIMEIILIIISIHKIKDLKIKVGLKIKDLIRTQIIKIYLYFQ